MTRSTTRAEKYTARPEALYVAFELSNRTWKLGMTVGFGQKARERNVPAGDLLRLKEEILTAKERLASPGTGWFIAAMRQGGMASGSTARCRRWQLRTWWWIHRASRFRGANDGPRRTGWMCTSSYGCCCGIG